MRGFRETDFVESAAMRFPQPVRVGDLLGREVLRPVESQNVLDRVRRVVRDRNGQIMVVIDFGGVLGFGSRLIAVPVDAMVLLVTARAPIFGSTMSWALGLIVFHVKTRLDSRRAKLCLRCLDIFGPADADRSCRISR
jgi:hypothetical protein